VTFAPFLRQLERELDIPYPERRQVLDELGGHLDELYDAYRSEGDSRERARERAMATLGVDDDTVSSLAAVHRTAVATALARLPRSVSLGLEYGAIALVAMSLIIVPLAQEAAMIQLILEGGIFMIPINLAGIAILVLAVERVYSLFIKKDHSDANLDRRLLSLGFLAIACALTGVLGTAMGFFQAFAAADRLPQPFPIFEVGRIALTTTILGLTLSLIAVTARFAVQAKVSRIRALQR
jgi:hypothetical protein